MKIREKDLRSTLYNTQESFPYGSIIIFRPKENVLVKINSEEEAKEFFDKYDSARSGNCPPGEIGRGVEILK